MLAMTALATVLLLAHCLAFAQPKEVFVSMRDGVRLALDLYFPSGPSSGLPVVLAWTVRGDSVYPAFAPAREADRA